MTSELREQLQATLGSAYALEGELGGGGMSRVFVAEETSLGRKVVVKVLPPDLSAGVNVERFKREIQVAARLQHPHIVPVLAAGQTNGMPYYTMPLVDGHSIRARLSRGPLSITEVIAVLRDVAKALAYAHDHSVVHRDIKPDNILITGGAAVVTDFGIAKAISASRTEPTGNTLTSVGSSLGTPAYMAPEQAAADPDTNHRADIYAFGCLAYELLAGQPPFHGRSPQKLLAAQMSEKPRPIRDLRGDVPTELSDLVMRCLEKDPDDRPQSASDMVRVLETVTSGGGHPAMPVLLRSQLSLARALGMWLVAFVIVMLLARAAIIAIGLPEWVFPGSVIVVMLGLPVIVFTWYSHRTTRRVLTTTPTLTPGGTPSRQSTMANLAIKASPHLTWRRAALGGVLAVLFFALLTAGYMAMRTMGIGPAASLFASGAITENERLLIADFRSPPSDTTLGPVITEAFRTGMSQSRVINVMQPAAVREVLRRMQRPVASRVDFQLAREVAQREGIKAVIDGDVIALGGKYVVTARLVTTLGGETLASFNESADEQSELLPAVDRLSREVRAKIGESLRTVRATLRLEQVTTPSLEALRKYVQGVRALSFDGEFAKGVALLEEAIALDTAFAMAYRKLAVELNNRGGEQARVLELMEKAYQHRDRLSDIERYLTMGSYFASGPRQDAAKAVAAYEALLDIDPDNGTALNNVAIEYYKARDFAKAEAVVRRAIEKNQPAGVYFNNLAFTQFMQGKFAEAEATVEAFARALPGNALWRLSKGALAYRRGMADSAALIYEEVARRRASDAAVFANAATARANLALLRGKLNEARRWHGDARNAARSRGVRSAPLDSVLDNAWADIWYLADTASALNRLQTGLRLFPLDSLPEIERPYERLGLVSALAGRPDRARMFLAQLEKLHARISRTEDRRIHSRFQGHIALSEGRYADAIREYRAADQGECVICVLPDLGRAHDLAGNSDSAIAIFTRFAESPQRQIASDAAVLPGIEKRLGELWEVRGDRNKALGYYLRFVERWKDADAQLQPAVNDARKRIAQLRDTEGR